MFHGYIGYGYLLFGFLAVVVKREEYVSSNGESEKDFAVFGRPAENGGNSIWIVADVEFSFHWIADDDPWFPGKVAFPGWVVWSPPSRRTAGTESSDSVSKWDGDALGHRDTSLGGSLSQCS